MKQNPIMPFSVFAKSTFLSWKQGKILENLSLCSEIHFIRYTQEGKKLGEDPGLIIQDLTFENIPVRLYQPRESKAQQKRRGVVFFHGGGWMFGSLSKASCKVSQAASAKNVFT